MIRMTGTLSPKRLVHFRPKRLVHFHRNSQSERFIVHLHFDNKYRINLSSYFNLSLFVYQSAVVLYKKKTTHFRPVCKTKMSYIVSIQNLFIILAVQFSTLQTLANHRTPCKQVCCVEIK